MSLRFFLDIPLLQETFDTYGEKVFSAVRPAAQAMAQVYYEALLRSYDAAGIDTKTGNLRGSLYQAFKPEYSKALGERQYTLARYSVSWAGRSDKSRKSSQHGHLIEQGHKWRYAVVRSKKTGDLVTAVRPEMRGKPKPKRSDPQYVKDAYFVLRKGGEVRVRARPFMGPVARNESLKPQALEAARRKFAEVMQ